LTKYCLGDFFTNSSGHPVAGAKTKTRGKFCACELHSKFMHWHEKPWKATAKQKDSKGANEKQLEGSYVHKHLRADLWLCKVPDSRSTTECARQPPPPKAEMIYS
jgi:hypothetical protein